MESIALRDNWREGQERKTTPILNKGKCDYLNTEDLGLSENSKSNDKGKMFWI